jgi:hypothetical protein
LAPARAVLALLRAAVPAVFAPVRALPELAERAVLEAPAALVAVALAPLRAVLAVVLAPEGARLAPAELLREERPDNDDDLG